jgi:hypothetical protein
MENEYGTRSKSKQPPTLIRQVYALEVVEGDSSSVQLEDSILLEEDRQEEGRAPRPKVPSNKVCGKDPRWRSADLREAKKLMDMDTFIPLPQDRNGRAIRPPGAICLRLLRVREFKWKRLTRIRE